MQLLAYGAGQTVVTLGYGLGVVCYDSAPRYVVDCFVLLLLQAGSAAPRCCPAVQVYNKMATKERSRGRREKERLGEGNDGVPGRSARHDVEKETKKSADGWRGGSQTLA